MEEILNKLNFLKITYKLVNHEPVYTIDEINNLKKDTFDNACICKTLFLQDQKGKRYILYVLSGEKKANLLQLAKQIKSSRLSFSSEEKLEEYLKVQKGSVTPLAILFDKERKVEVVIDKEILLKEKIAIHPGINTYTVLISPKDLIKFINENKIQYI